MTIIKKEIILEVSVMKKNILKTIAISIFALSMAVGAGSLFAHAKVNSGAEIVLAEGEETPEDAEETTPEESQETPKEDEEKPAEEESKPDETPQPTKRDFLNAFIATFKDAWADLIAHFKRWFHK